MRARMSIILAVVFGALPCIGAEPVPLERREPDRSSASAGKSLAGQPRAAEQWDEDLPQFGARWYRITGDDVAGTGSSVGIPTNPNDVGRRPSRMPAQHGVEDAAQDDDVADQPTGLPDDGRAVIIASCVAFWLIFVACVWRYAR